MKTFINEQKARKIIEEKGLTKNGIVCEWGNADLSITIIKLVDGIWEYKNEKS